MVLRIWAKGILGLTAIKSAFNLSSSSAWDSKLFLASYNIHFNPSSLGLLAVKSSNLVFLTLTSMIGFGVILSPLPFLCHNCSEDVHAVVGFMSSSESSCVVSLHAYKENLQSFSIKAKT